MTTDYSNQSEAQNSLKRAAILDKTFTLRQVRKYMFILIAISAVFYIWQVLRIGWADKMGGVNVRSSPYYNEIPEDCKNFADRHVWHTAPHDGLFLRSRPIRVPDKYLTPEYGRIRCLGYAVLTGLTMTRVTDTNPLHANFVDTYVDAQGDPIVRITVDYLQPYTYAPKTTKEKIKP